VKLVRVAPGNDNLFRRTLNEVMEFTERMEHAEVPASWYAESLARLYNQASPDMLLVAALDDCGVIVGHMLALGELRYGRKVAFCYQVRIQGKWPMGERLAVLRQGLLVLRGWAVERGCAAILLATPHSPKAMARLFPGFRPTFTLMESGLEGSNG